MNLHAYRSSFVIFVADSNLERGGQIVTSLSDTGYSAEHRLSMDSLLSEMLKNPPHIILFYYKDLHFFADGGSYEAVIEKIQHHLPEVQIIFLASAQDLPTACNLYEFGIYDCLPWPLIHSMQLLRAVDRAAVNNYYMYLNEQLSEKNSAGGSHNEADFAMYNIWLKGLDATQDRETAIHVWIEEAVRVFNTDEAIYFRYIESKKSIIATDSIGFSALELQNVGLDLGEQEPGFHTQMLSEPNKIRAFHDFVINGLQREQALYFPLIFDEQVLGVFCIPAKSGKYFADKDYDNAYLQTCIRMLQRHFYLLELKQKYLKHSIYDDQSEALGPDFILKKMTEEISRARRISRPVSLLCLSIDHYEDLVLQYPKERISKLLKSFTDIIVKNSRLNDLAGRVGSDQFVLCLPHTDKRGAAVKAERLRRLVETADVSTVLAPGVKVNVSVGISEYPSICYDTEGLFKSAELAMIEVKKAGGNRICLASAPARFTPDFIVKEVKSAPTNGG